MCSTHPKLGKRIGKGHLAKCPPCREGTNHWCDLLPYINHHAHITTLCNLMLGVHHQGGRCTLILRRIWISTISTISTPCTQEHLHPGPYMLGTGASQHQFSISVQLLLALCHIPKPSIPPGCRTTSPMHHHLALRQQEQDGRQSTCLRWDTLDVAKKCKPLGNVWGHAP